MSRKSQDVEKLKRTENTKITLKSVIAMDIIYVYESIYTVYLSTLHTCTHTHTLTRTYKGLIFKCVLGFWRMG